MSAPRLFVILLMEWVGSYLSMDEVQGLFVFLSFFLDFKLQVAILRTRVLPSPSLFHAPSANLKEITDPFQCQPGCHSRYLKAAASLELRVTPGNSSNFHHRHCHLGHDYPNSDARGPQQFDLGAGFVVGTHNVHTLTMTNSIRFLRVP